MNANDSRLAQRLCGRRWAAGLLCAILLSGAGSLCRAAADSSSELTWAQFRSLVAARLSTEPNPRSKSHEKAPPAQPDWRAADGVFAALLAAQAREDAARQSLDRLSGWKKVIEIRAQTQTVPALDVETIQFAEAKASAEADQFASERRRAVQRANALLGRPPDSPLTALVQPQNAQSPAAGAAAGNPQLDKWEKEILPQGRDLLTKTYQSYMFGGTPLAALLWQEQQLHSTELAYRLAVSQQSMEASDVKQF